MEKRVHLYIGSKGARFVPIFGKSRDFLKKYLSVGVYRHFFGAGRGDLYAKKEGRLFSVMVWVTRRCGSSYVIGGSAAIAHGYPW